MDANEFATAANVAHSESQGRERKTITGQVGGQTTLKANEQMVRITLPASGTHTVTLAPPPRAVGRFVDIEVEGTGEGTVTLVAEGCTNVVLSVAKNFAIYMSNGMKYRSISSKTGA